MNERIREPYYSLVYEASQGWNDHLFQVPPELLEKFAELIVRECCDIVNKRSQHNNSHDCLTVLEIKEHFGVEE